MGSLQIGNYPWENPSIDLNLKHYADKPSDVFKIIKSNIEDYLEDPNVSFEQRSIYSAVYNAINYYIDVTYLPSAEYKTEETFLSNSIETFNSDYKFLGEKYNSTNPSVSPVVSMSGRIKSPYSFMEKVKEKVNEYLEQGRDLQYFTESIRDLIGIRLVIDPPEEIKKQGKQAESDFLYQIYYDLMSKHGLLTHSNAKDSFSFIPVNSRYDKTKNQKIKDRVAAKGFSKDAYDENGNLKLFIPETRPSYMNLPEVDSICKDYNMYPKFFGYQSLHTCVTPQFSSAVKERKLPDCILPSKSKDRSFEYQFRLASQHKIAEEGFASHKHLYKPDQKYHRLLIPFYITSDIDSFEHMSTQNIPTLDSLIAPTLKLRNFGESFAKYLGFSFESYFGITFDRFRDTFTENTRNAILSGKKLVSYDREHDRYKAIDAQPAPLTLTVDDLLEIRQGLQDPNIDRKEFLEKFGLNDSTLLMVVNNETGKVSKTQTPQTKPEIYPIQHVSTPTVKYYIRNPEEAKRVLKTKKVIIRPRKTDPDFPEGH